MLPENDDALDFIASLIQNSPYVAIRSREELYHILRSWESTPYIFTEDDRKVGYCVVKDYESVTEIAALREEDFPAMVRTIVAHLNQTDFLIPDFQPAYSQVLGDICSQQRIFSRKMFSVLNYKRVLEAFLRLKASYTTLPNGELTVRIHGIAGNENLHISVTDGVISVENVDVETSATEIGENIDFSNIQIEMSHLEAMRFFFSPDCVRRRSAPDFVKLWFPLPLWIYAADCV